MRLVIAPTQTISFIKRVVHTTSICKTHWKNHPSTCRCAALRPPTLCPNSGTANSKNQTNKCEMLNVRIADAEEASTRNTGTNNWCLQHPGAGEQPEPRLYGANASGIPCVCVGVGCTETTLQHVCARLRTCRRFPGFRVRAIVPATHPQRHGKYVSGFSVGNFHFNPSTVTVAGPGLHYPQQVLLPSEAFVLIWEGKKKKTVWSNNTRRSRSLGYIHGYENRNETFHMGVSFGSRFFTWSLFPTCPASVNSRVSEKRTLGTMSEAYWINFDSFAVEEQ